MKKHFSRALATLLVLAMVLSMLPVMAFAASVEPGDGAAFMNGLPGDGKFGVIYSCGENYSHVFGYDINDGNAPALAVELTNDGEAIQDLPAGTAIFKFVKLDDNGTYYLILGSKYLVCKDIDSNNKEKLVLCDTPEFGAKWTIIPDKGNMQGAYNIMNAEYKYNGGAYQSDVYLEQYNGSKFCGYSYKSSTPQYFQFKFAETAADDDGRVGNVDPGDPLPAVGDTVVIYNDYAKGVFGQPTGPEAPKPNLLAAAATRTETGSGHAIAYSSIGDGGLIFTVSKVTDNGTDYWMYKTGDKYLGMSVNEMVDGKLVSAESMILIPESDLDTTDAQGVALREYAKWDLSEIANGWLMHNKTAVYKGYPVYVEYFDDLFCGYSFDASRAEIFSMNFYKVTDKYNCGYVVNPSLEIETPAPYIGADCPIKFTVNDLTPLTAISATYTVDSTAHTVEPVMNQKVGSFTIPAADLEGGKKLTVKVDATDEMNLSYSKSITVDIKDEPLILSVQPGANTATGDEKQPDIIVKYVNGGPNPTFSMEIDGEAVTVTAGDGQFSYKPAAPMADGKHSVSASITRADGKSAARNWSFFIGESAMSLYYGQVHAHTAEYSDGAGTLEQAYEHAHGVDDMDFIVITDHSNYFDTTATATTSSYYDLSSLAKNAAGTTTKWEEARATALEYNEMYDDFVCIYGYEMTWSGGPGHTNTFNTYGVVSRNNKELNNKTSYAGMHRYNDLMVHAEKGLDIDGKEAKTTRNGEEVTGVYATKYIPFDEAGESVPVISQFNHPGTTFGNFDNFAGYTAKRDDVLNLIEVGNGEGKVGGSSYFPSYEQYDLCLSMGWHVAPTNNQDNHKGNWGNSNTCRDVILTDDFSEIGIYRALDARHVYATEDQNLEIYYELEAAGVVYQLGDIAALDEDNQPDTVTVRLTVNEQENEKISKIQVIGEGARVLHEITVNNSTYKDSFSISNTDGYYYIKVIEADGQIAVTAPVWTKEAVPVAADLESSASVAAQGEEETITATLTNGSETETVTLTGYKVTAEDRVIEEKTGLTEAVAPGTDKVVALPFTPSPTDPSAKKTYEITVEFSFTYKGKAQTLTRTIEETSYPPELMTYIGLDKGHTNFYVSGDYADNDGSFIQICAERGIICQYIDAGQMTKENLKKYKAVVLTVPRKDEYNAPTVWTAEELEAIADYAANGGNLINLSKSDRYDYVVLGEDGKDTYEFASANISNLINEAVGAKTRFVRGIVVDNEMKSNEAYRINFNGAELLGDHLFTTGIFASSNGQYQFYNGTGITVEEGADTVTTLVAPYPTTWIASYKANFTGSSYVPNYDSDTVMAGKGTFSLVTAETLPGGGFLVCAGACFISNYDLKFGTAANEQYENYGLVCNILDYIKEGEQTYDITPIADVHKGEVGQEFTIEGSVTSNASDYDKDTAFFDCIYVQDETRGINCFPVSGYYYIGEQVRVHGAVTYYCGEIELNLSPEYNGSVQVISNDLKVIEPKQVKCKAAMSDDNIGNLMKIKGVITEINRTEGVIDKIYVDDGSGEPALLFINSYIQKDYHGLDDAEVGMMCEGVGIGSRDVDEESGGADGAVGDIDPSLYIKRLRVRARDEIRCYVDPCARFTDVNRDSWYHEGVDYALNAGIMQGTSETTFSPTKTLTRGQVVTILYRLAGEPEVTASNPFTDVKEGKFYYEAVLWAVEKGITSGKSATRFDPNGSVTREQLATFIYRYAKDAGFDVSAKADLSSFPDVDDLGKYAVEPMQWAVGVGLIGGVASGGVDYIKPKNNTTRAQVATILMRFDAMEVDNKNDIVILYTNDVHCGIDNDSKSFGYAGLAAYKAEMESKHDYVALVDAGDFIQGAAIGSLSKGAHIISIMNEVGYDVVTLGNHEFDYGVDNILALTQQAEFDFVTANWKYTGPAGNANAVDLPAYKIVEYGDVKIAYVGITTPESLVKSTPTYFQDESGNWIYDFCNDESGEALYEAVQAAVDAAKAEDADYVVALAHLGTDGSSAPWRSTDVIRNTTGIDAVLDGHSHSVIECNMVANKDGKEIPLTSTGTKLANIGKMTITAEGEIKTELIGRADYNAVDEGTAAFIAGIEAEYEELLNQVVVEGLSVDLSITNPNRLDNQGNPMRAVRFQETNLGDVCADAYVYASEADIGIVNGGGVRANIPAGDVTFAQIIAVHPFGNELCVVEATGQQIADALEMSSRSVALNAEGLPENENGGFLQVSGLSYTIYTGTATTVVTDTAGMFSSVSGERRVGDIKILNKATGEYEPIDLAKTYTVASHNYMLKEGGDGLNMFMSCKIIRDGGMLDNEVLINYFNSDTFRTRLAQGWYNSWDGYNARITLSPDEAPQGEPPAADSYVLSTELKSDDEVIIVLKDGNRAVSTTANGTKLEPKTVTVTDDAVTGDVEGVVFTVAVDTNGYLSFIADGKYLTSGATGNSLTLADAPSEYSLWTLDEGEGGFFLRNVNAQYSGNPQFLEFYNNLFTVYGKRTTDDPAKYLVNFYVKYVEPEFVDSEGVNDESQVILVLKDGNRAVSNVANGTKLEPHAVTVEDGVLTDPVDEIIFTAKIDGNGYISLLNGGKYLTSGATGNSLTLADAPGDYSLWTLDEGEGGFFLRSVNAQYSGNPQFLEFYNNLFTVYGKRATDDPAKYLINLYVLGGYEPPVGVNTAALEAVIAEAEALDLTAYTEDSANAVTTALAAAQAVLAKEDKTQAEVDEAAAALRAAIDALVPANAAMYAPVDSLNTGDVVVLYNAGNSKAVKSEMSGYYVAGADVLYTDGQIANPDAPILWTVTVNDDGTYTFRQGDKVLAAGQTIKDEAAGTYYNNLYLTEADHTVKWTPVTCNAANKSVVLYAGELDEHAAKDHIYLEWYGARSAFSAYDTNASSATEANFGFQFFAPVGD